MPRNDPITRREAARLFTEFDRMGEEIPAQAPWLAPHAQEWDQLTVQDFVHGQTGHRGTREYIRLAVSSTCTAEMHELSLLRFLWYAKQVDGIEHLFSAAERASEYKPIGGTQQISEALAKWIGGGAERIRLSEPVYYLEQRETVRSDGFQVLVRTLTGAEYRSRYCILAIPPAGQQKIHYRPALPAMRNQLLQRTPMGTVIKCFVYYRTAFWRDAGYSGSMLIEGNDTQAFPVSYTLEDTKPDDCRHKSYPAIVGFIPADKARRVMSLSQAERKRLVCESYARVMGLDQARHVSTS